jgi:hypothetical protein
MVVLLIYCVFSGRDHVVGPFIGPNGDRQYVAEGRRRHPLRSHCIRRGDWGSKTLWPENPSPASFLILTDRLRLRTFSHFPKVRTARQRCRRGVRPPRQVSYCGTNRNAWMSPFGSLPWRHARLRRHASIMNSRIFRLPCLPAPAYHGHDIPARVWRFRISCGRTSTVTRAYVRPWPALTARSSPPQHLKAALQMDDAKTGVRR